MTTSTRDGGLPNSSALPAPRGTTASPPSLASAIARLSWSIDAGRTTQRGRTPSTVAASREPPSSRTRSRPAIVTRASPIERAATAIAALDPGAVRHARSCGTESLAAGRVRGKELAGIHDQLGIERAPQPIHEIQVRFGVLQRKILGLVEADAVLAGHRAPHLDAGAQQLLVRRLGSLELLGLTVVVEDERMQVAVAGMEHVGDL